MLMGKTILVLLDACRLDTVTQAAGYLEHLVQQGRGAKYRVWGELPTMSRPMYETVLTGLPVLRHGITDNGVVRRSRCENLFRLCRARGLETAAAAYSWMSELYSKAPFDPMADRFQPDGPGDICHGIFYYEDSYPDSHLFLDGEFLRKKYTPDFLLIHSMNIDLEGHRHGSQSREYLDAALGAGEALGRLLPGWLEDGYRVVVTADHGMNSLGQHGGDSPELRTLPLYIFAPEVQPGDHTQQAVSQLNVAPLICRLLEIPPAAEMVQELEIVMT